MQLEDRERYSSRASPGPCGCTRCPGRRRPPARQACPSLSGRPSSGREAERAELRRCLDQAVRGQGALVMIGGEPGVGKTRLAEELLLEARQRGVLA